MEQSWLQIYRNFDDDALAAMASVGLVRRAAKDVEAGKVAWQTPPDASQATLRADGQLVKLAASGPARASCDCPAPGICKHILAATLWLRATAPPVPAPDVRVWEAQPEPSAPVKARRLAAGATPAQKMVQAGLSDNERQYLVRLRALLLEICASGWAHVSEIMPPQLRGLAVSARIEAFPRLAGMLRTLAGTTELLCKRDLGADEHQAMRLAARIVALSHALEQAHGEQLRDLRGAARRSFSSSATEALELLPLGAHWWELRSGARGLTMAFWDAASQRIMQASLARSDGNDRNFNRELAWSASALWAGAGSAHLLGKSALRLDNARVSDDERISLSTDTRASALAPWRTDDPRWQAAGHSDWQALAAALRTSAGLRGTAVNCVLLKPATIERPVVDEISQLLNWTLRDIGGAALTLQLSCEPEHHRRIDNIEGWAEHGATIKGVLARLERSLHGGRLEPLSLVIEQQGMLRSVSLDYEAPARRASLSLVQRLSRMFAPRTASTANAPTAPAAPVSAHSDWLEHLQLIMENKALTGRLHIIGEDQHSLSSLHSFLHASGMDLMANALRRYLDRPNADRAMALIYLCQVCAEMNVA